MTWIKICGMTKREDALAAVDAGCDAIGFVFGASPRQVSAITAEAIATALPADIVRVGVFSDHSAEQVEETARQVGLDVIQLHGSETTEFARSLFQHSPDNRPLIFKAVWMVGDDGQKLRDFASEEAVDGILLDSAVLRAGIREGAELVRGGTGVTLDWNRARDFVSELGARTRLIIAGGLTPANVADAIRILQPWGVDVCSGVERSPGVKDQDKLRAFVAAVRTMSGSTAA
jgi:phosphoribosylanthranilate isomerase